MNLNMTDDSWSSHMPTIVSIYSKHVGCVLRLLNRTDCYQGCGSGSWKRFFSCGSGSAKIPLLPLPLPHRLFDLESNLAKKFCPFLNVELSGEVAL